MQLETQNAHVRPLVKCFLCREDSFTFQAKYKKVVAQSTTEAELIALNSCAKSSIYLFGVLKTFIFVVTAKERL